MRDLILGSRGSQLALWQTEHVRTLLSSRFPDATFRVEIIKTLGDRILDAPLSQVGDKGLFTREIENALLDRRVDIAVHSLKDLPTELPDGLALGAVSPREDPRDAFLAHPKKKLRSLLDVPRHGKVATGSLRRSSQLLSFRSDINIIDVRGNLNTRLAKLDESDWDGMILACAGVKRLGWLDRITEIIPPSTMLPAVGQGALGIEVREDDVEARDALRGIHDTDCHDAVMAERAFLRRVEGGCQIPVGTYARIIEGVLHMDAFIGSLDGRNAVRQTSTGPRNDPERLGVGLAEEMLNAGGREILEEIRGRSYS